MTGRTDGPRLHRFRMAKTVAAESKPYAGQADDKSSGQQYPALIRFYESLDKGQGEECQGRVQGVADGASEPYCQTGPSSAGERARNAQQSQRSYRYGDYHPD